MITFIKNAFIHTLRKHLNTSKCTMYKLAAFGNPLLDITVKITTEELLNKHDLKHDDQIDIPADKLRSIYADIKTFPNHISPGGCAQNTIRVLQWLLQQPSATVYFGGIGNDDQGKTLTDLVQKSGVTTKYLIHEEHSTGTCIALVSGENRSLVAHLGAAGHFNIEDLSPDELDIIKSIPICYMEGFFLINRLEVAKQIQNLCNKSLFVFNLCGPYLCRLYPTEMSEFAKKCDILFGNYQEFKTLGEILNIKDPRQIAMSLNKTYEKKDQNPLLRFGKLVVVTNGANNIFCVYDTGKFLEINVPKIPPEDIQDTTGAGDSFVAGFLAAFLEELDLGQCVEYGCWAARQIIKQTGCTIPDFEPDIDNIL